jgi:hypothetical protein
VLLEPRGARLPVPGVPGHLVGRARPLLDELELGPQVGGLLLLGQPLLRASLGLGLLGEPPPVGQEGRLHQQERRVQGGEGQRVLVRLVGGGHRGRQPDARDGVVDGDEGHGQQERRPHLVQRDQREQHVEPDVQVGEAAADVQQHVGPDHEAQADGAGPGSLAAHRHPEHHQDGDHGELAPQQPAAHAPDEADERQGRHVGDQHPRGHPVAGPEAAGVEPGATGDGRPEPAADVVVAVRGMHGGGGHDGSSATGPRLLSPDGFREAGGACVWRQRRLGRVHRTRCPGCWPGRPAAGDSGAMTFAYSYGTAHAVVMVGSVGSAEGLVPRQIGPAHATIGRVTGRSRKALCGAYVAVDEQTVWPPEDYDTCQLCAECATLAAL